MEILLIAHMQEENPDTNKWDFQGNLNKESTSPAIFSLKVQ